MSYVGNLGEVQVGANVVAEVVDFDVDEPHDTVENHAMGDTSKSHLPVIGGWSGKLTCQIDRTDTTGQGALTSGASVSLSLYGEGDSTGKKYKTGTATITNITESHSKGDIATVSFDFLGNGALTEDTVV